ncbi:MAG: adenine phosphoribosyltransferase [bacterium]
MGNSTVNDEIKNKIRTVPNWPKQGIMFRDITTLLSDASTMEKTINLFYERYKDKSVDIVVGIESRGFIFGSLLAGKLGIGFVPIRKKGKLPAETFTQEYELEYGTDAVEIHKDAIKNGNRVLLIDDLIATGGTALAACELINRLGGQIIECAFIIDLPDLKGMEKLKQRGYKTYNLVHFEGE